MAKVFIFNAIQGPLQVSVNDGQPVAVGGADGGNGYAPPTAAVERLDMAAPGIFGQGDNGVGLFPPGIAEGYFVIINIGDEVPPAMDLQLYLFSAHAVLVSGLGEVVFVPTTS